jgi:hypothetical protein
MIEKRKRPETQSFSLFGSSKQVNRDKDALLQKKIAPLLRQHIVFMEHN